MNTEFLIGKITEISHLTREEQFDLLEKARYEVSVNEGKASRLSLYFFICLCSIFCLGLIPIILWNNAVITIIFSSLGILAALHNYMWLYKSIIAGALKDILSESSQ